MKLLFLYKHLTVAKDSLTSDQEKQRAAKNVRKKAYRGSSLPNKWELN
jgi:hypothetical protein